MGWSPRGAGSLEAGGWALPPPASRGLGALSPGSSVVQGPNAMVPSVPNSQIPVSSPSDEGSLLPYREVVMSLHPRISSLGLWPGHSLHIPLENASAPPNHHHKVLW